MCDTPFYSKIKTPRNINGQWTDKIPLPCGKCPICKKKNLRQWMFRLLQEDKTSQSSKFITLTYNNENVPITKKGLMTLDKKDVQDFMKRLRRYDEELWKKTYNEKKPSIKYYLVGEYGTKTKRPHYHMIIFNLFSMKSLYKAWKKEGLPIGQIHEGKTEQGSIAYTLKYMDKEEQIPQFKGDDRIKEFSLKSTNLGKSYITPNIIEYHKKNLDRPYLIQDGFKVTIPKYYKNLIFNEDEMERVNNNINEYHTRIDQETTTEIEKKGYDVQEYRENERYYRYTKFQRELNTRNKI